MAYVFLMLKGLQDLNLIGHLFLEWNVRFTMLSFKPCLFKNEWDVSLSKSHVDLCYKEHAGKFKNLTLKVTDFNFFIVIQIKILRVIFRSHSINYTKITSSFKFLFLILTLNRLGGLNLCIAWGGVWRPPTL